MNQFQKLFLYQLLLTLFVFNVGSVVYAQDMSEEQNNDIPVFDETDEGMSDGEIAGLVAGSVAGLAVGATAIGVGIKKYQDNKKKAPRPPTIDLGEAEVLKESEKVSSDSEKVRKILDDAFGEEAQKKEQRDQENQRRLDEKKKVYDDARVEWKKADKAVQDLQKQLMIYKNAPDINPDAKPPVIEAAEKERDRLYKVANEKQKVMVAHEQELKAVKVEIKQGFQAEAKALDALVEESTKRASEYKSRAAVVAEQQKADEQKAKNVQKDLEKKQQALQDAGMELHKANIAVADAGDALRNVKNANRYIEYETDEVKKAEAEAKEKKAKEKFEERKAAVGRAQVHAERLAGEVDALEQKVQEIKLRPQAQEAVRPVVDDPVVFEEKMRRVPLEENPMHPVLKDLPTPDEVKSKYEKRQLMQDDLAESKFKAQQDEEARLKKMAEDRRANKQKKKQSMVIGKPVFVRVGDQAMTSDDKKNIDLMKSKHTEEAKLSQAKLSKKKLAESVEDARINRARKKAQKNKNSFKGKVMRKIPGR